MDPRISCSEYRKKLNQLHETINSTTDTANITKAQKDLISSGVLFDLSDFSLLGSFNYWCVTSDSRGYFRVTTNTDRKTIYLPRVLLAAPEGLQVDHINRNSLDNRRSNLRLCSARENAWNRTVKQTKQTELPKGITQLKSGNYRARLGYMGMYITVGTFSNLTDAVAALHTRRIKYHGEFSHGS